MLQLYIYVRVLINARTAKYALVEFDRGICTGLVRLEDSESFSATPALLLLLQCLQCLLVYC